jgi:hypothetical protein
MLGAATFLWLVGARTRCQIEPDQLIQQGSVAFSEHNHNAALRIHYSVLTVIESH